MTEISYRIQTMTHSQGMIEQEIDINVYPSGYVHSYAMTETEGSDEYSSMTHNQAIKALK